MLCVFFFFVSVIVYTGWWMCVCVWTSKHTRRLLAISGERPMQRVECERGKGKCGSAWARVRRLRIGVELVPYGGWCLCCAIDFIHWIVLHFVYKNWIYANLCSFCLQRRRKILVSVWFHQIKTIPATQQLIKTNNHLKPNKLNGKLWIAIYWHNIFGVLKLATNGVDTIRFIEFTK